MPPENSCGKAVARRSRVRDADQVEQFDGARWRAAPRPTPLVDPDRLGDLVADPVDRGERGERVLEDHRDRAVPRIAGQLLVAEPEQFAARRSRTEPVTRACVRQQPHTASAVTDLPEPDSPTMPSTSPGATS